MKVMEYFICSTSQISNGSEFQVQTTDYSELLSFFERNDNIFAALIEDGDPYVSRATRHFVAYTMGREMFKDTPYRFVKQLVLQKPTWWTDSNGTYYPVVYYIFEVLKNG